MATDHEDLDALFADLERLEAVTAASSAEPEAAPEPAAGSDPLAALGAVEAQIESLVTDARPEPEPAADPSPPAARRPPAFPPGEDTDDPLAGGFDPVSEVLAGVFDDMAAFVEEAAADAPILHATIGSPPLPAEPEPEPAPAPEPDRPVGEAPGPAAEADPADVVAVATAARQRDPARVLASTWRRAEPSVKWALTQVSYPMRLLPDQARRIVDWVALTLVFWVPIVWAIALLVVG